MNISQNGDNEEPPGSTNTEENQKQFENLSSEKKDAYKRYTSFSENKDRTVNEWETACKSVSLKNSQVEYFFSKEGTVEIFRPFQTQFQQ